MSQQQSLIDVYKSVLEKSLELSGCTLQNSVLEDINNSILTQLKNIAKAEGINASVLDGPHARAIFMSCQRLNIDQKFALNETSTRGRFKKLRHSFKDVKVVYEDNVNENIYDGLQNFVGLFKEFSKIGGYFTNVAQLVRNKKDDLKIQHLIHEDLIEKPLFLCSDGLRSSKGDNILGDVELDSISYVHVKPIKITFYAHNPTSVKMTSKTSWTKSSFNYKWIAEENDSCMNAMFSYANVTNITASLKAELEFKVTKSFEPKTWAVVLSLGINALLNDLQTQVWTCKQFEMLFFGTKDCFKSKEKLIIQITEEQADEYIKMEMRLLQMKRRLGKTDEIKKLSIAYNPFQSVNAMVSQQNLPFNPGYLNILNEAVQEAFSSLIQTYSKVLSKFKTFADLSADKTALNTLLGGVFEEITAGQIMIEAAKQGMNIERILGDGLGVLPNGTRTPQYSDLIFFDKKTGKYYSYQLKSSHDSQYAKSMIESFYQKHGTKEFTPGVPPELEMANIEIIVNKNMQIDPFDVSVLDPVSKKTVVKRIQPKSTIKLEKIEVEAPAYDCLESLLDQNFDVLKDINKNGLVGNKKLLDKKIDAIQKKIIIGKTKINQHLQDGNSQAAENLEIGLNKLQENMSNLKTDLEATNNALKEETAKLKPQQRDITKVEADEAKALRKYNLKMIGIQCLIGSVIDGVTTLVITIDQQREKYKKGEITGAEMAQVVAWETVKASSRGAVIAGVFAGGAYGLELMAQSSSSGIATIGNIGGKTLGPALIFMSLAYQSYNIIHSYNNGEITPNERNKLLGRMVTTTGISIGAMYAATAMIGPWGLVVGAAACIATALGDYFFGDKIFSLFCEDDSVKTHDQFERAVVDKAYELFDLEENCTDLEIKEAYKAALLRYHPDKCTGNKTEKDKHKSITQAIVAAYTLIKERRNMK